MIHSLQRHLFATCCAAGLFSSAMAQGTMTWSLVVDGLDRPVFAAAPDGDLERLFVVEHKSGLIRIVRDDAVLPTPFLDLSAKLSTNWQQGAFSIAFHPNYEANGFCYVYYTDVNEDSVLELGRRWAPSMVTEAPPRMFPVRKTAFSLETTRSVIRWMYLGSSDWRRSRRSSQGPRSSTTTLSPPSDSLAAVMAPP